MKSSDSVSYLKAYFTGRVQGVGFRYSTSQLAKGYELTGFVSNLADGRVELLVEGAESECRAFFKALNDEMDAYIKKVESSTGEKERSFQGFSIL